MLIRNVAEDVPYYAALYCLQHFLVVYLLKCYLVSFSRYKLIQTVLLLNTMNKTKMTRREISFFDETVGEKEISTLIIAIKRRAGGGEKL